jgi:hypothetical protein
VAERCGNALLMQNVTGGDDVLLNLVEIHDALTSVLPMSNAIRQPTQNVHHGGHA